MADAAFKVCPFCKEQIRQEAIKCRFCGEWLEPSEPASARKLTTDQPVLPPSTPPQEGAEPNSMKTVSRALDERDHQQRPANPPIQDIQNKTTPKAGAKTGTRTKSVWRLIVGALLVGGAANSLQRPGDHALSHDELVFTILFAAIGVWLVVSYLSKRPMRTLLIMGVGVLAFAIGPAYYLYYLQKSKEESNKKFGSAVRAFTDEAQRYWEGGGNGSAPTIKPTGDATNDLLGRVMNDIFQDIGPVIARMNTELKGLEEKDVFETSVLTNKASLETEARKRIESQRIIAKYRNDLPRAIDAFRHKLASYNIPGELKKNAVTGFEDAPSNLFHQYETMFNLLGKKEKTELDFLYFMVGTFNEYELKGRKISFHNATAGQRYDELAKSIEDTAKETAAVRKECLDDLNTDIQKLSR